MTVPIKWEFGPRPQRQRKGGWLLILLLGAGFPSVSHIAHRASYHKKEVKVLGSFPLFPV